MKVPIFYSNSWTSFPFHSNHLKVFKNSESGFSGILQLQTDGISVERKDGTGISSSELQLKEAAQKYFKRNQSLLCIHLSTNSEDPPKVSVRTHGFFSYVIGPEQQEFSTLKLSLSFALFTKDLRKCQGKIVLMMEFPVYPLKFELEKSADIKNESCVGSEPVISQDLNLKNVYLMLKHLYENGERFFVTGICEAVFVSSPPSIDPLSIIEKVKDRTCNSDIMILTMDGAQLPCHKHFLAAHSSVLATMIASGLEETKSEIIKMSDVSKETAIAFLDFLYERDMQKPTESSQVALDLLQAGHKYDINSLEDSMKTLLIAKPSSWFDKEVAGHLFLFARNVEGCEELKRKAAQVIKSMSDTFMESEVHNEFFKPKPLLFVELFSSL